MTSRTVARRYAGALLDAALSEGDPQQIEREVAQFAAALDGHQGLTRVLVNPAVSTVRKRALVAALLDRAPETSPIVRKLLLLLAERDRFRLFADLVAAYRDRLMEHQQVVRAEVTSAVALPEDRTAALAGSLARATGKRVTLSTRTDPALIGGVVARIGSTVYDGSVARQLERIKERLTEEGY